MRKVFGIDNIPTQLYWAPGVVYAAVGEEAISAASLLLDAQPLHYKGAHTFQTHKEFWRCHLDITPSGEAQLLTEKRRDPGPFNFRYIKTYLCGIREYSIDDPPGGVNYGMQYPDVWRADGAQRATVDVAAVFWHEQRNTPGVLWYAHPSPKQEALTARTIAQKARKAPHGPLLTDYRSWGSTRRSFRLYENIWGAYEIRPVGFEKQNLNYTLVKDVAYGHIRPTDMLYGARLPMKIEALDV